MGAKATGARISRSDRKGTGDRTEINENGREQLILGRNVWDERKSEEFRTDRDGSIDHVGESRWECNAW